LWRIKLIWRSGFVVPVEVRWAGGGVLEFREVVGIGRFGKMERRAIGILEGVEKRGGLVKEFMAK
jgi:hypothetical protein